jgi:hypothetical protein
MKLKMKGKKKLNLKYVQKNYKVKQKSDKIPKMHSRCFGIMGGHGDFAFNLVVKLSVELGYVSLSLRL